MKRKQDNENEEAEERLCVRVGKEERCRTKHLKSSRAAKGQRGSHMSTLNTQLSSFCCTMMKKSFPQCRLDELSTGGKKKLQL